MGVVVHIDKFSGPLGLLLHLIRQQEMDIFDINIHEITKQYLESIRAMKKLNLEVASDFIALAATLIQIKSKMLLPQYDESGEVVEEADPRKDLVRRLLEYQMYQDASQSLYKRDLLGRNAWARGRREDINVPDDEVVLEEENALYALISLYRGAMKRMKKAVHRVAESLQSISERIMQMRDHLIVGRPTNFFSLVEVGAGGDGTVAPAARKGHLLITFLSLLELAKIGLVHLFQSENYADIHIETRGTIDSNVISAVESYEGKVPAQAGPLFDFAAADVETPAETATRVALAPTVVEEPLVQAATDAEIEAEELKYGE